MSSMIRTRALARFILCAVLFLPAARFTRADDWLAVPPEDLAMKDNPKQAGADAMVLYREVTVDAKSATVTNYLRVKIFTAEGVKKQGDVEIPYNRSDESIRDVHGRTIRPNGAIVDFDGHTFDKEIVKGEGIKYLAKTFTIPDVEPGAIIEYRYREQYNDQYYWNLQWIVQENLFTRQARFSIKPDDSSYALALRYRSYNLPPDLLPRKDGSRFTLEIHDLPGIEEENLMLPMRTLQARIEFFYLDRDVPDNETQEQFWKRIGKKWSDNVDHFVDKKKEMASEVARITSPADAPEVRLRKLYARAEQIHNLDMEQSKSQKEEKQEAVKPNSNVDDVLKHGYGHSVEINCLFIGLARAAGFTAADVRVAPRNQNFFDPPKRSTDELSDELVWVRADSNDYYLDPSTIYYPFGLLPWPEAGAQGIRVTKDGSEIVTTPALVGPQSTVVRHADVAVSTSGDYSGKLTVDFAGIQAAMKRYDNREEDETGRKHTFEDEIKGWLPVGATFEITALDNWTDIEKPIHIEGTMNVPSFGGGSYQRLLLPLELFQAPEPQWFDPQKRVNTVYFSYPYETTDDLVWHVPLTFTVQNLPDPPKIHPGAVAYDISAAPQPDGVEVKRDLLVNGIVYTKDMYPALRQFFSLVKADDNARFLLQSGTPAHRN